MASLRSLTAPCVTLAALTAAPVATAQEAAEAARRELISHAERASDRGDHARAVELFTRAGQVRMSTSLRQALAEELVHTRAWLRAYIEAVQCQREANADPSLTYRGEILRDCARVEARARPHLGQLVVEAPASVESLRVRIAGADLSRALWGMPYPVSAGVTAVEAATDDGRTFREEVSVAEGQTRTVRVSLPEPPRPVIAAPAHPTPPPAPPSPLTSARPRVIPHAAPPAEPAPSSGLRIAAWSALGVGVLGVGAGVVSTVLASERADAFNAMRACGEADPNRGAAGCADAYDSAVTMQTLAATSWVVGGVGLAAGAILLALPTARRSPAGAQRWTASVGPGTVGASLVGRF